MVTRKESEAEGTAEQQNAIQKSTPVISSQSDTGTAGDAKFSTPPNQIRERVRFEQLPSAQQTAINQALVSLLSKKGYDGPSLGASANSPTSLQELLAALEKANSIPEGHTILRNTTMTRLEWDMLANQMAAASAAQQSAPSGHDNPGSASGITGQSAGHIMNNLPPDAQAKMNMYFANDMKGMMNAGMMKPGSQALSSEDPPMLQWLGDWFLKRKHLFATAKGDLVLLSLTDDDFALMQWGIAQDPAGMAKAVGDGAVISGKVYVNGQATVIVQTVTLGYYADQIQLIHVNEDEMPYYQNGSFFLQGGSNLALALAPGMAATKLARIPRAVQYARGLTMVDSLQNSVLASRGAWDAYNNGLSFSNSLAMGGGILGLGGNAASIRQIGKVEAAAAAARGSVPRGAGSISDSGRMAGFMADIRGLGPLVLLTGKRGEKFAKLMDFLPTRNIDADFDPKLSDDVAGIIDELLGTLRLNPRTATLDTLAHELQHVRFAKLLGKWGTGKKLTLLEVSLMEMLAHHMNYQKGIRLDSSAVGKFLDDVEPALEAYVWQIYKALKDMKKGDENYRSMRKIIQLFGIKEIIASLQFGGKGMNERELARTLKVLAKFFGM